MALTAAIAMLLIAVTLTTRQPPPPAIAEFSPQAVEPIKEQPKEQASQFGSGGEGDCPPGAECAAGEGAGVGVGGSTTTTTAAIAATTSLPPRASVKRCVGDPPRQIEDPQSPPCIAFWDASNGNGGATWQGVTADTITLGVPDVGFEDEMNAYQTFFNDRFQLYGRRVRWVATGNGIAGADNAEQLGVFAAMSSYNDMPYYRQLAKHQIIGFYRTPEFSDSELTASAPYIWGYVMSFTQILANLGDWACNRLAGQRATHAGRMDTQQLSASDRKFAILLDRGTPDSSAEPSVLRSALEQCGAEVPVVEVYQRFDQDAVRLRNLVTKMKTGGVTTAFCLCVSTNLVNLQSHADSQAYEPEWIITNYPQLIQGDGYTGSQMNRTFGVSFVPMDRVRADHPQTWAIREGDPDNADKIMAEKEAFTGAIVYRTWLALMSGIQMAGPNLTPETFRAGLHRTRFPNPDHPIMAGDVGFHGDYSMTDDGAEFWVSTTDAGPYGRNQGPTFCWVDGGRRHARGTWPEGGDPFFSGPCDSGNQSVS